MAGKIYICLLVFVSAVLWSHALADTAEEATRRNSRSSVPSAKVDSAPVGERSAPAEQGWGALSGRFVYDGKLPKARTVATSSKHAEKYGQHAVRDESLLVDPATKGIQNIVVFARKVSRVHKPSESVEPGLHGQPAFEITSGIFVPHVVAMQLDQLLSIKNKSQVVHILLVRPPLGREINILLVPGGETRASFSFRHYLPVPVTCGFHRWMKAFVFAREDPYVAVTDRYGWFQIPNLPAGEDIEFQVWHESARGRGGALVAMPDWTSGRFRRTIPRDGVEQLGIIRVPSTAFNVREP